MVERLSYDSSSVVDERGDVVPAEDYLDAYGDIIERPIQDDDKDINVHVEPVKPREEEFKKAEAEYDRRLEELADRPNSNYVLARLELASRNIFPPDRSMYGLLPDNQIGTQGDAEISAAVPKAILEDSARENVKRAYARTIHGPEADRQREMEANRQRALFRTHSEQRHSSN